MPFHVTETCDIALRRKRHRKHSGSRAKQLDRFLSLVKRSIAVVVKTEHGAESCGQDFGALFKTSNPFRIVCGLPALIHCACRAKVADSIHGMEESELHAPCNLGTDLTLPFSRNSDNPQQEKTEIAKIMIASFTHHALGRRFLRF